MRDRPKQAGVVLVLTLWLLVLLTIMATGYSYATRIETQLTVHIVEIARTKAIAEAGLWLAVSDLLKPPPKRRWPTDGSTVAINFATQKINLRIQDEAGKIDLNTANPELLHAVIKTVAGDDKQTPFLLDAILDWRDRDSNRRRSGAEDSDYNNVDYDAKDGPFNSIDELRLVAGVNNKIYVKIHPLLTVHSLLPGINPMVAPRELLLALPGSDAAQINKFLASRKKTGANAVIPDAGSEYFISHRDRTFTVTSEGIVGQSRVKLDMVILLSGNTSRPYLALSWEENRSARISHQAMR